MELPSLIFTIYILPADLYVFNGKIYDSKCYSCLQILIFCGIFFFTWKCFRRRGKLLSGQLCKIWQSNKYILTFNFTVVLNIHHLFRFTCIFINFAHQISWILYPFFSIHFLEFWSMSFNSFFTVGD